MIGLILMSCSLLASWQSKMNTLLTTFHTATAVNRPGVFQDQQAGLFTGGGGSIRMPVKNKNLVRFDPPSVASGCNGIDFFTGGMSYIRSAELVNTMKAIASSAVSYAFGLAVQTVTPQIKAVLDTVHAQMMRINALSLNSCEKAAALAAGLWPKTEASKQLYCSTKGLGVGRFDDWASARHECSSPQGRERIDQIKDTRFMTQLGSSYNLVWEALNHTGLLANEDTNWKELFLSLTGTLETTPHYHKNYHAQLFVHLGSAPPKHTQHLSLIHI